MTDRTPAEILVARLSGVDDHAERVRMVAEALDEAMMAGVDAERAEWRRHLEARADVAAAEADGWRQSGAPDAASRLHAQATALRSAARGV